MRRPGPDGQRADRRGRPLNESLRLGPLRPDDAGCRWGSPVARREDLIVGHSRLYAVDGPRPPRPTDEGGTPGRVARWSGWKAVMCGHPVVRASRGAGFSEATRSGGGGCPRALVGSGQQNRWAGSEGALRHPLAPTPLPSRGNPVVRCAQEPGADTRRPATPRTMDPEPQRPAAARSRGQRAGSKANWTGVPTARSGCGRPAKAPPSLGVSLGSAVARWPRVISSHLPIVGFEGLP